MGAPQLVGSLASLMIVKALLRVVGFARTIRLIRARAQKMPTVGNVDHEMVIALENTVATAAALYPGRALCLEQSLVLYYLLRRLGIAAAYCQGVQAYPFQAHAWVEYQGQVINDVPEHTAVFAKMPDLLP